MEDYFPLEENNCSRFQFINVIKCKINHQAINVCSQISYISDFWPNTKSKVQDNFFLTDNISVTLSN